jgi:hypothetical protein
MKYTTLIVPLQLGLPFSSTLLYFVMPQGDTRCWVTKSSLISHECNDLGLGESLLSFLAEEQITKSLNKLSQLSIKAGH